jgi:agmatinase
MKFYLHNSSMSKADVIMLGVPDSSGSKSKRAKGVAMAPDHIRRISNELDVFDKKGERKVQASTGIIGQKVYDAGDVKKKDLRKEVAGIIKAGKIPIILGGDHSITLEILRGVNDVKKNIALIYFDAHPDFRCTDEEYYGSVVCDISKMSNFKIEKSVEVGIRAAEKEEIENLKSKKMMTITPFDVQDIGIKKVFEKIKKRVGNSHVFVSLDMDVLDPAFAPGVDVPVPGGISSEELIYLVKKIAGLKVVGLDIVEINPQFDKENMTSHLASRIVAEFLESLG